MKEDKDDENENEQKWHDGEIICCFQKHPKTGYELPFHCKVALGLLTLTVAVNTICSVITVWTSQWKRTEFDTPIRIGTYNLKSIQYGPLFYCARHDDPAFVDDTNVACQLNFVDTASSSGAFAFNIIKGFAALTASLALAFYSSFWNRRAFYEYRSVILVMQVCSAIITLLLFEGFGNTNASIRDNRDYVWALYSEGDKISWAIGYTGFIICNIIMPIVFFIILQLVVCGSTNERRRGQCHVTCKTTFHEGLHLFLVLFFGFWYLYFCSSSRWSTKTLDATGAEQDQAVDLAKMTSLGYLFSTPPDVSNSTIPSSWGVAKTIEQGPWSECIRFEPLDGADGDGYQTCHMDLSGASERIRRVSLIRIFMLGGIITVVSEAVLSIGRLFIHSDELYHFANVVLPGINLVCTAATIFLWAFGGEDNQLSEWTTTKGIWAAGKLDIAWFMIMAMWFCYTGVIVYWYLYRDTFVGPKQKEETVNDPDDLQYTPDENLTAAELEIRAQYNTTQEDIDANMISNLTPYHERTTEDLPPDLFWSSVWGDEPELIMKHEMYSESVLWWAILILSSIALILFGIASFQEWTEIEVSYGGQNWLIRTYLFGYQCFVSSTQNSYTSCDDGFKFSGTKTRMNRMQSIFSFYFITVVLLMWGIYEHIRNRMKPWNRTGWFATTFLASLCGFSIFWDYGDTTEYEDFAAFMTQRSSHISKIFSDIYAGQDMTYLKDIVDVPDDQDVDVDYDDYFYGYAVGFFLIFLVTMLQLYSAVLKWNNTVYNFSFSEIMQLRDEKSSKRQATASSQIELGGDNTENE